MLKVKKPPSPQELYKARKQREEEEKDAYLPPGLINHGNTCFMNSTLQGLIATQSLHDLVVLGSTNPHLFDYTGLSILSRRSPLLTNGHGVGGQYEQSWVEGMPLGDRWITVMKRAWAIQDSRKRESMSPKDVLTTIGSKFDQYLDFQQQDAHEFLRHLLDAMRMEEYDIIKKRQPPPPKAKRRHHENHSSEASASSLPPDPNATSNKPLLDEVKLESFVDMLFGGRLASILVCEKCKKISTTYEDFNDLSLSIKPEDYAKERKRDRFKMIAKKLRFKPKELGVGPVPMQRASSVPASPIRRSSDMIPHDDVPVNEGPRRGSFDHPRPENLVSDDEVKKTDFAASVPPLEPPAVFDDDGDGDDEREKEVKVVMEPSKLSAELKYADSRNGVHAHFDEPRVESQKGARKEERDSKEKSKDDAWNKLGRRVSVAMKMGSKNASKRLSRSMDRHRNRDVDAPKEDESLKEPSRPVSRRSTVESGSDIGDQSDANRSRAVSPARSPLTSPPLVPNGNPFEMHRTPSDPVVEKRAKSPRPPKATREEAEYLRKVLADIHPSASSAISLLHQALSNGAGANSSAASFLTKLGYLPGIEECLRLFTAVEVLDGENMVGCHRCWKIANGTYNPRHHASILHEDDENGSEDNGEDSLKVVDFVDIAADSASSSPDLAKLSPASTTAIYATAIPSSVLLSETSSVFSAPATMESISTKVDEMSLLPPPHPDSFGGLPIPSISTTAPESPLVSSIPSGTPTFPPSRPDSSLGASPASSLLPPVTKRRKHKSSKRTDESSDSSDDDFDTDASDASASVYSDASSAASSIASPSVSPRTSLSKLRPERPDIPRTLSTDSTLPTAKPKSSIPRAQQVIPRRMYKRYLVATPPPILVVHLKRFQQASKMPVMSFSAGFRKMDEFVAFPEYLDLSPYLAPRKEDFGLGKASKNKTKRKIGKSKDGKCNYRLYAVVVHIGNMLGGHYIAYTALPSSGPQKIQSPPSSPDLAGLTPTVVPSEPDHRHAEPHCDSNKEKEKEKTLPPPPRQWAYISDTIVRLTTLEEVLKAKAYICMYERV
ncbi:cysteine proteinase [Cristinia sonorae]|uniref:Cysteine proteinase n=1 Tax=Cristinia sonorae TaxID=1940300 RepID=A0A8K0USU6_9AGAR|nr:cysteine proteinase [Cristinia sonorae]